MENTMTMEKVRFEKAYEDEFSLFCIDEKDYIEALKTLGESRQSDKVKINEIVFKAMPTPMEAYDMCSGDDLLLKATLDTVESGTKVYVEINGNPFLLRNTALSSIYERLRIGGDVLNELPAELLAQHLNDYAKCATNEGLAIVNNAKLEAILGMKYNLVPVEDIMDSASEYFATGDKPALFVGGSYTHTYSDAMWKTGECRLESPIDTGFGDITFEQSVVVSTSDCGRKAITVAPKMRQTDDKFGLEYCLPLKLEHDGRASVAEFEKMLKLIDKRFHDANDRICDMAQTYLNHPANVLLSMYKWLKIPAKYGAQVYERRKLMWDGIEKTSYDVYASLSEVLSLIIGEEENSKNLVMYQERFARALRFDYRGYDLPGEYGYQDKLIGAKGV